MVKTPKKAIVRYRAAIIAAILFVVFVLLVPPVAEKALASLGSQLLSMALIIPPIFLLLGLLDVWVPRETFMKFLGGKAGVKGKLIAFALGSAAAGPLYGAFPVASVLMRKGASLSNVLVFIGAWSTTKIPMLLFEMQSLGMRFALARLVIDIPGIIIIGWAVKAFLPEADIKRMYERADNQGQMP